VPEYSFECEDCQTLFIEVWAISAYDKKIKSVQCPACHSKHVYRDYQSDRVTPNYIKGLHECTTIGEYADKQTEKYGKDKCEEMTRGFNEYRNKKSTKELPKGMSRMESTDQLPSSLIKSQAKRKRKKKG